MPPRPSLSALRFAPPLLCLFWALRGIAGGADGEGPAGLVLSLDAADQARARQEASLPPLSPLAFAETWIDAVSPDRMALQPVAERRPVFHARPDVAFFRFDGKDDFLAFNGPRRLAAEVTLFVLAAPRGNPGGFAALLSMGENGKNDFTSGLNLDLGPSATDDLSVLNLESAGAGGFSDLLEPSLLGAADRPFGGFHLFTVRSRIGEGGNELFFDGIKAGARDRLESHIGLDRILIGARSYSHDPAQPPYAQGTFHGDIAVVRIYDRSLDESERTAVEAQLMGRLAALNAMAGGEEGHALETLADPPVVQMLVPGFSVEELPLKLGNLNNVRYREDGKVLALGYDGRLHLLSDRDGDGLEDHADLYWDAETMRGPLGIALTPPGDPRGPGVFVASKGKVSFFPDRDGDNKADGEEIVATGWKETFHGVDTLGLALDPRDGSLYFGLGCTNFADAYLIDKATGKSAYDPAGERGTIQRLSADFSRRETICSGVRFTCALAFNRHGDLFATDQEGATWLPNGNPFDELLHIEAGKHYGFPPRHPRHLPDVIDQPAVFEFGPQHQSTVGMVFNEAVEGGKFFGPPHWENDALVCGQSRGKLWRTRLVKTPQGYVAQSHLIACLGLLVVDACVSPAGDLLVVCHSGPPDWGSGPKGEGRLFKIRYRRPELPQPVTAWAAAPDEFRIAFDKPLDPADWSEVLDRVRIEAGEHVSAGDRFEVVRPGYQVVRDQMAAPRRWVETLGLSLSRDRRTLVLRVPRQTGPDGYAVTLPLPESWKGKDGLDQVGEMDIALTLNGVVGELAESGEGGERVVLPHPSVAVSRELTLGSADHEVFVAAAENRPADLRLSGRVAVSNPFVPTVQPGSSLDWDPADDPFSAARFDLHDEAGKVVAGTPSKDDSSSLALENLAVATDAPSGLFLGRGELRHPVSPQKILLPWAETTAAESKEESQRSRTTGLPRPRDDVKGDWLAGKRLYFGKGACYTCHTLRGEGLALGPDLTNLVHRDRDSVVEDLRRPSATLNPDHPAHLVTLKNGASFTGVMRRTEGDHLHLALPGGASQEIAENEVASVKILETSLMPEALWGDLDPGEQENLLTFLLSNPLEPSPITRTEPPLPPARPRSELQRYLPEPLSPEARQSLKPLRILLAAGDKDHGADEHDYPLWQARWSRLLALADRVTVDTCMGFPSAAQLDGADVTVFYSRNQGWNEESAALLDAYQERGGGLVYIHFAIEGGKHVLPLAERIGLAFSFSKFRHGTMELVFPEKDHPITRGFSGVTFLDESYWRLHGDRKRLRILGTSQEEGEAQPQLWTLERGAGRVFGCIPGHYMWTFDDPLYRLLLLRGIAWAAGENEVDRFSELATVGARVRP